MITREALGPLEAIHVLAKCKRLEQGPLASTPLAFHEYDLTSQKVLLQVEEPSPVDELGE